MYTPMINYNDAVAISLQPIHHLKLPVHVNIGVNKLGGIINLN